jgi:pyruvate-formate lyase-activating enzyme/predicted RNA-binding Zn-ribbon protein involved in translation (DUF1610 family)
MCWQGIRFKPPSPTTDPDNPFWGKDIDYESPPSDGVERNDKQQTQSTPSRVVTTTFPENKKKQSTPSRVKPTPSFPEKELQDKKCREDKGKIGLSATLDGIDCPADLDEQDKAREDHFRDAAAKSTPTRFDVIYQPGGAALEYAPWACNIVKSPIKDKYKGVIGPKICSHGCLYCFNQQGTESDPILKDDIINRLNRDLSKLKKIIKRSERLEFTFVGDLYDPALPEGIARQCLMACKEAGIPFQVLTKGGMKAVRDFDIYGPGDWFGVTLTGRDEWEPGAAPTEDRIAALQEAHGRGIKTWVSFEPVLDPERTLELIKRVDLFVDDIKIGILNPKKHNPKEVKELADRIDWPKFYHEAVALCVRLGRVEGQNFMIKDDLKKAAAKLSTGAEEVKADDLTCSVCGTEIGPGHGSYGDDLCPSCGPAMLVARAAMKAHAGGATISELWEELAARGNRPPRREYLPKMLAKLGCHEEDNWKWEEAGAS